MVMMHMFMERMGIRCITPCRYMYRTMRIQARVSMRALMLQAQAVVRRGLVGRVQV
jgi:hypothetical protein